MPIKYWLTLSKSSRIFAILFPMVGMITGQAKSEDFNTGYVLEKMPKRESLAHIDGTVRGIAYAHYYNHNKDQSGFDCISNHGVGGENTAWQDMVNFLWKHTDKPLGGVLFIYLRKKCGL